MSTDLTTEVQKSEAQKPKPERLVVQDNSPGAYMLDTARFEQCYRIARAMASGSIIPEHLTIGKYINTDGKSVKGDLPLEMVVANMFMIVNQALRWGIDPFAVPAETYVVGNKLGFQGKLVMAVINSRAGLHQPLQCVYNNERADNMAAVVFGSRSPIPDAAWPLLKAYAKSEDGDAYTDLLSIGVMCIRITVAQAKTSNDMWRKDPSQKLLYTGATKWARRHTPEIIMGVFTDDDLDCIRDKEPQPTPPARSVAELTAKLRLPATQVTQATMDDLEAEFAETERNRGDAAE